MLRHVSEIVRSDERILIVGKKVPQLMSLLSARLEQYDVAIQKADALPPSYTRFQRIFFLASKPPSDLYIPSAIKVIVVLIKPHGKVISIPPTKKNMKFILISSENITDDELTQLLWFSVSMSSETTLDLRTKRLRLRERSAVKSKTSSIFLRRRVSRAFMLIFMAVCFGYLVPLVPSTLMHISMLDASLKNNYVQVAQLRPMSSFLTNASAILFIPARPLYSLFSVSLFPESFIQLNTHIENYLEATRNLAQAEQRLLQSFNASSSSSFPNYKQILAQIDKANNQTHDYLERIITNLPNHPSLESLHTGLKNKELVSDKITKALPIATSFTNSPANQILMLLVVNNARVRGSGGVIDSVGIIKIRDHRIISSQFFSAKQLEPKDFNLETVAPILVSDTPGEINMLNDATTSVDLYDAQNKIVENISSILQGERPTTTLLITTTALQNILSVFPALQLNDNREIITSENISIKQQLYGSDPIFFPAVLDRISQTLGTVDPSAFLSAIITSLNEKQLAILSRQPDIQKMLDGLYWSGKTIAPKCISSSNCINDYLFSVDQDLSSRKGPAYIQKSESKSVRFINSTTLESTVRILWKNESPLSATQGGNYQIYTQLLLPQTSKVTQITKNNVLVEEVDTLTGQYNILGLYLEVSPRQATELSITYTMPARLRDSTNYQLITQKQIGSFTSNFSFDLIVPETYELNSKNIDAVVNSQRISYNDILNTDKLFFVVLKKKD